MSSATSMTSMSTKIFLAIVGALFFGLFLSVIVFHQASTGNNITIQVTGKAFTALHHSIKLRTSFTDVIALDERVLSMSEMISHEDIKRIYILKRDCVADEEVRR